MRYIIFYFLFIVCLVPQSSKGELLEAVRDSNVMRLKELLKEKINLEITDSNELTALMLASRDNNLELVQLLSEAGANLNAKNKENGRTPLMLAASHGHTEIIKYLASQKRILINAKDKEGKTALIHSVIHGKKDSVALLIEYKANVNARTNTDDSALLFSQKLGRAEISALLKQAGARE
ncbi:MAG: ankyrin repeat domain-containing protein [Leptospiraceae bacterium]|nr:ankyrin repeat domain-containing protein [Leptospiraceae bacterium]